MEVLLQRQLWLEGVLRGELPPLPDALASTTTHTHARTRFCLTTISFIPSAGGEADRGGDPEGSEGGAIHYAPEPVHPQYQGGLPAERYLWIQASDQEAAHVHVSGDADASSTVS